MVFLLLLQKFQTLFMSGKATVSEIIIFTYFLPQKKDSGLPGELFFRDPVRRKLIFFLASKNNKCTK